MVFVAHKRGASEGKTKIAEIRDKRRIISVSYTHLDVYKRQHFSSQSATCGRSSVLCRSGAVRAHPFIGSALPALPQPGDKVRAGNGPHAVCYDAVSYTHLFETAIRGERFIMDMITQLRAVRNRYDEINNQLQRCV